MSKYQPYIWRILSEMSDPHRGLISFMVPPNTSPNIIARRLLDKGYRCSVTQTGGRLVVQR